MTRRQVQQGDSLEMLLDTMCNTFGGIILIALLIALLARETKVSEAETRRVTESTAISRGIRRRGNWRARNNYKRNWTPVPPTRRRRARCD